MNATRSWHIPQYLPRKISSIDTWLAPALGRKGEGWQLAQSSHSVCDSCGKSTCGISFVFRITTSSLSTFIFASADIPARGTMAPERSASIQSGKPTASFFNCRVASSMVCRRPKSGFDASYIGCCSSAWRAGCSSTAWLAGRLSGSGSTGRTLGAALRAAKSPLGPATAADPTKPGITRISTSHRDARHKKPQRPRPTDGAPESFLCSHRAGMPPQPDAYLIPRRWATPP
jgi:hypothetical protein